MSETLKPGTLEQLLAADDTPVQPVEVPEWGISVTVRGFRRAEALQWSSATDTPEESDAIALHYGIVDPAVTMEQAREIVTTKSQKAVARIVREVITLSGLGDVFRRAAESGVPEGEAS